MKYIITLCILGLGLMLHGQSLSAKLSTDSLLLGHSFQLSFILENTDGTFEPPSLKEFQVVSGPNYSSSVRIINGDMTSRKSISYTLRPRSVGQFYIPPAYVISNDESLETLPLEINVYPNPDGVAEELPVTEDSWFETFSWPAIPGEKPVPEKLKKSKSDKPLRRI